MKYLPTAFANLSFAWKLYNYGLDGRIDLEALDVPLRFQEEGMMFVLPDRIFESRDDLILALENNLGIAFGAAAITLYRACEEHGHRRPVEIHSERDQCLALISQIRNAFAHDIAEPRWAISIPQHRRRFEFGAVRADLRDLNGERFRYEDIGGPETLLHIKQFAEANLLHEPIA